MADRKISDLTALTTPATGDLLPIVDVSEVAAADKNKKITVQELFKGVPDGTAAAPGLAFESDDGNGIYLAGTDTVAISTGGTQRLSVNASGVVTITGDLQVEGTTTTIESTTLTIDDKNIELGSVDTPTDTTADGGGITLKGATDKTINWVNSTDAWTSSERFDFPAGTAAAPSIILNGDVNSGLYQPGADQVAISTGGSARLYIAADGDVGVGTTSPSTNLQVDGSWVSNYGTVNITGPDDGLIGVGLRNSSTYLGGVFFRDGTAGDFLELNSQGSRSIRALTNGSEALRIDSSQRVGIGTSSPTDVLHINSSSTQLKLQSSSSVNNCILHTNGTTDSWRVGMNLGLTNGSYEFYDDVNNVDRMVITSAGNVGIGTTSPADTLHVNQSASGDILRLNTTSGSGQGIILGVDTSGGFTYWKNNTSSSYDMRFEVGGGEKLRIDSSGAVGIGTSSPGAEYFGSAQVLHISGSGGGAIKLERTDATARKWEIGCSTAGNFDIADTVFSTSAPRLRIDTSGRVGIGTASPNYKLHLHSATTGDSNYLQITHADAGSGSSDGLQLGLGTGSSPIAYIAQKENAAMVFQTNASEQVRIDSSGRLLVGTSNNRSTYNAGSVAPQVQIEGTGFGPSSMSLTRNANSTGLPAFFFGKTRGSSVGSNGIVANNDELGSLEFQGNDGTNMVRAAMIRGGVDGTPGSNDMPGRLVFYTTADGASSPTERFRIGSSGQLGIGGATYGSSGQVLTSNGSSSAPSWQDAGGGGGKVLQVTSGTKTSRSYFNTSTGWLDAGLSASITPSNTAHKVLVHFSISIGSSGGAEGRVRLLRGSTAIMVGDDSGDNDTEATGFYDNHGSDEDGVTIAGSFLDSPSTTSATTYKMQIYSMSGNQFSVAGNVAANNNIINTRSACSIVLMEIDD